MKSLRMLVWMTVLLGLIYPLVMTAIANVILFEKAKGSLVKRGDQIVGSTLIGQKFESEHYFWLRPSAVDYNTLPSGGSNLGPTSAALAKEVGERRKSLITADQGNTIPSELLFASGSGLDPHITPEGLYFQIERVAKARKMEREKLKEFVDAFIQKRHFTFLTRRYLNVLKLNLALDAKEQKDARERK
jgi:potassium-transporting ATPase KdpC subunit